jgi:hypothetical protein
MGGAADGGVAVAKFPLLAGGCGIVYDGVVSGFVLVGLVFVDMELLGEFVPILAISGRIASNSLR